jgi:hypothetical protein
VDNPPPQVFLGFSREVTCIESSHILYTLETRKVSNIICSG